MNSWNLETLIPLVLESGRIGLSYFDYPEKEYKADDSIVTLADKTIEAFLTDRLEDVDQGVYLLGEETIAQKPEDYLTSAFRRTAWVIDPIDGTAPFANNLPNWGVSIGFMQKGVLKEGIVFLAALGELYYSDKGTTWREKLGADPALWASRLGQPVALKPPASPEIPRGCMISISQQLARFGSYRLPFYVQVTGSSVFNMTRLAAGSFGALVTRFKLWDFAACLPLLNNLGWTMVFHGSGQSMGLTMDDSAIINIAGHPDRWSSLDHVVFAPSRTAADLVRQKISFADEIGSAAQNEPLNRLE
jgi:fructose-1,6-bisphosphatase/inositol monophosphatase family enzyme